MVEAASVFLNFKTNTAQITGEVQKIGEGVKKMSDTFDQASQKIQATGKKIENSIAGIQKIFELDVVGQFAETIQKGFERVFEESSQSEKSFKSLEQTIRSTGGAAGVTAKQVTEMSDQLSKINGIDDDVINGMESVLLGFTKLGKDVLPAASQAAIDLSAKMGTSLTSSAEKLGKALSQPAKAAMLFKDAGVSFSAAQQQMLKDMQKTGDIAEADTIILDKLNESIGGAGAAARDTLSGALNQVNLDMDDFFKALGGPQGAGLEPFRLALEEVNVVIQEFTDEIKNGAASTNPLIAGITAFGKVTVDIIVWAAQMVKNGINDMVGSVMYFADLLTKIPGPIGAMFKQFETEAALVAPKVVSAIGTIGSALADPKLHAKNNALFQGIEDGIEDIKKKALKNIDDIHAKAESFKGGARTPEAESGPSKEQAKQEKSAQSILDSFQKRNNALRDELSGHKALTAGYEAEAKLAALSALPLKERVEFTKQLTKLEADRAALEKQKGQQDDEKRLQSVLNKHEEINKQLQNQLNGEKELNPIEKARAEIENAIKAGKQYNLDTQNKIMAAAQKEVEIRKGLDIKGDNERLDKVLAGEKEKLKELQNELAGHKELNAVEQAQKAIEDSIKAGKEFTVEKQKEILDYANQIKDAELQQKQEAGFDNIQKITDEMKQQALEANYKLTGQEALIPQLKAEQKIREEIQKAGIDPNSARAQSMLADEQKAAQAVRDTNMAIQHQKDVVDYVTASTESWRKKSAELFQLLNSGQITQAQYREGIKKVGEEAKKAGDENAKWVSTIEKSFDKAIDGGEKLGKIFKDLLKDLVKLAAQQLLFKPLENWLSGGMQGGIGGIQGPIGALGKFLTGTRASGGPVDKGGTYLVGERGPELLQMGPGSSGNIIPNHKLTSAMMQGAPGRLFGGSVSGPVTFGGGNSESSSGGGAGGGSGGDMRAPTTSDFLKIWQDFYHAQYDSYYQRWTNRDPLISSRELDGAEKVMRQWDGYTDAAAVGFQFQANGLPGLMAKYPGAFGNIDPAVLNWLQNSGVPNLLPGFPAQPMSPLGGDGGGPPDGWVGPMSADYYFGPSGMNPDFGRMYGGGSNYGSGSNYGANSNYGQNSYYGSGSNYGANSNYGQNSYYGAGNNGTGTDWAGTSPGFRGPGGSASSPFYDPNSSGGWSSQDWNGGPQKNDPQTQELRKFVSDMIDKSLGYDPGGMSELKKLLDITDWTDRASQDVRTSTGDTVGDLANEALSALTNWGNFTQLSAGARGALSDLVASLNANQGLSAGRPGSLWSTGKLQKFADGGRPTPGVPAIIGEEGPEMWIPDSAGTIIPNGGFNRHGGHGGGNGGTGDINVHINQLPGMPTPEIVRNGSEIQVNYNRQHLAAASNGHVQSQTAAYTNGQPRRPRRN